MMSTHLYVVENLRTGLPVATHVEIAGSSALRRKGLLGTASLKAGSGLWIAPCEAVHTFGMRIPIDAVFLDKRLQVRKVAAHLPPRRIAICLAAQSVLEVAAGAAALSGTEPGDALSFRPKELESGRP